jgi:hypothetical protein
MICLVYQKTVALVWRPFLFGKSFSKPLKNAQCKPLAAVQ